MAVGPADRADAGNVPVRHEAALVALRSAGLDVRDVTCGDPDQPDRCVTVFWPREPSEADRARVAVLLPKTSVAHAV